MVRLVPITGPPGPYSSRGRRSVPVSSGQTPRLGELVDGDLKWSIDFRRVCATLLDQWLGLAAETVLGQRFENLLLLEA
jgi:hypothetical protein